MSKEKDFFEYPVNVRQKQYEALRAFYNDGLSATETAERFGYTLSSFYSITNTGVFPEGPIPE